MYKKVDIESYVRDGLESGKLIPFWAIKKGKVRMRKANDGEEIITWSSDSLGNEVKEKVAKAEKDDLILTKVDESGKAIVDKNNHLNEWIVKKETFMEKYEPDIEGTGLFKPIVKEQLFVRINDDIILNNNMKIAQGGYINITNALDMYGVSKRDFLDTYEVIKEENKKIR